MSAATLHSLGPMLAAFLASLVEFVEALTVVLAVGAARGWRDALLGSAAALLLLLVLVLALGPALSRIPLRAVQLLVGTLLLLFGLRWLRKAMLRSAGVIALHDENAAYAAQLQSWGQAQPAPGRHDALALLATFKITLLEGLEVVFIVVAVAAGGATCGCQPASGRSPRCCWSVRLVCCCIGRCPTSRRTRSSSPSVCC